MTDDRIYTHCRECGKPLMRSEYLSGFCSASCTEDYYGESFRENARRDADERNNDEPEEEQEDDR